MWANRILPVKDRQGCVYVGEYHEPLSCCGEIKGIQLEHDFTSEPGRVIECVVCAFCGHDFESQDITSFYDEYDHNEAIDRAIDEKKGS